VAALDDLIFSVAIFAFGLSLMAFVRAFKTTLPRISSRLPRRVLIFMIPLIAFIIILFVIEKFDISTTVLIGTGLMVMTPLALTAAGECINEKAGVVNIGLEGMLLITALAGAYGARYFNSWAGGLFLGTLIGTIIGFLFAVICVYGRAHQVIAGIGINILAAGLVPYLLMAIWAFPGIHVLPNELKMPLLSTPLGLLSPIVFVAVGVAIAAHFILHRTLWGLRVIAAGEKPEAVDVAGVSVNRIRLITCVLGGTLCGLAGAFMSVAWFGAVTKEMVAGRGFIALACVVFAGLEPLLALAGAFIFGFAEGLAYTIMVTPGVKAVIPVEFIHMIPYITTLVVVTAVIGRRGFPQASGKPYIRE
jgi:simple sugar transport system permease protein